MMKLSCRKAKKKKRFYLACFRNWLNMKCFFFFITSYSIEFSWVITNVCHVNYHAPGENHPHWRHLDGHQGPFSDHWTSSTCKQFIFHAVPSIHLNFWTLFQAIGLRITLVILGFVLLQRNEIKRRKFIIQFHFTNILVHSVLLIALQMLLWKLINN